MTRVVLAISTLLCVAAQLQAPICAAQDHQQACDFSKWHPRRLPVFYVGENPPKVDGKLDDAVWDAAPWSEPFQDIRGPRHWSQPWLATRVKLLYDRERLYVAAYMEEESVWANVTRRNDVVFHDNDFEVFIDADGSTHNYKELELNAVNTTWNLWLDRPYRDGGHENSTRVDPHFGFDMFGKGLHSAVFVPGAVNDPHERLHFWTAEVALPLAELARHSTASVPPKPLTFWRINFSRVQWPVRVVTSTGGGWRYEKVAERSEENWVWSSQYAVDMHRPEWWGYMQFRPPTEVASEEIVVPFDPEWNVRFVAFQLYYAQHRFFDKHNSFATSVTDLLQYYDVQEAAWCAKTVDIRVTPSAFTFRLVVANITSHYLATISSNSFIRVEQQLSEYPFMLEVE